MNRPTEPSAFNQVPPIPPTPAPTSEEAVVEDEVDSFMEEEKGHDMSVDEGDEAQQADEEDEESMNQMEEGEEEEDYDVDGSTADLNQLIDSATHTARLPPSHFTSVRSEMLFENDHDGVDEANELINNPDSRETILEDVLDQLDHIPESLRTILEELLEHHTHDCNPLKYCSVEEFHSMIDSHLHPSGGGEYEYVGKLVQQLESALKLSQQELAKYMKTKELDFNEMGPFMIEQKRIKEELIKQRAILFPLESPLWQACINYLKDVRSVSTNRYLSLPSPPVDTLAHSLRPFPMSTLTATASGDRPETVIASDACQPTSNSSAGIIGLDGVMMASVDHHQSITSDELMVVDPYILPATDGMDGDEDVDELLDEVAEGRFGRYQWMCDQIQEYERVLQGRPCFQPVKVNPLRMIKSATSAYIFFSNAMRDRVKHEHPDLLSGAVVQRISDLWANTPAGEKEPYNQAAAADQIRWEKEMAEYKAAHPMDDPQRVDEKIDTHGLVWKNVQLFLKETTFIGAEVKETIQFLFTQPNFMIVSDHLVIDWSGWNSINLQSDDYAPLDPSLPLDRKLLRSLDALIDCIIELTDDFLDDDDALDDEFYRIWTVNSELPDLICVDPGTAPYQPLVPRIKSFERRLDDSVGSYTEATNRDHRQELTEMLEDAKALLKEPFADTHDLSLELSPEARALKEDQLLKLRVHLEQQRTETIIPRSNMELLIREIVQKFIHNDSTIDFTPEAIDALHVAAEDYLIKQFDSAAAEMVSLKHIFPLTCDRCYRSIPRGEIKYRCRECKSPEVYLCQSCWSLPGIVSSMTVNVTDSTITPEAATSDSTSDFESTPSSPLHTFGPAAHLTSHEYVRSQFVGDPVEEVPLTTFNRERPRNPQYRWNRIRII